jgi:hypothetical protein
VGEVDCGIWYSQSGISNLDSNLSSVRLGNFRIWYSLLFTPSKRKVSLSFPTQGSHYHPLKNALFAKANVHKEEQAFREDMEKTSKWMMEARISHTAIGV